MYLYYGHPLPYDVATEALKFKVRHINIWLDSVLESERVLKEVVWLEVLLLSWAAAAAAVRCFCGCCCCLRSAVTARDDVHIIPTWLAGFLVRDNCYSGCLICCLAFSFFFFLLLVLLFCCWLAFCTAPCPVRHCLCRGLLINICWFQETFGWMPSYQV